MSILRATSFFGSKTTQLFHGSHEIVWQPRYDLGAGNEFGAGFYCVRDESVATGFACADGKPGIVNSYALNAAGLQVLDLTTEPQGILNWLALLLENRSIEATSPLMAAAKEHAVRSYLPRFSDVDIIFAWRADGHRLSYARAFLENEIPLEALAAALGTAGDAFQVVLKSRKALDQLRLSGFDEAGSVTECSRYIAADFEARAAAEKRISEIARSNTFAQRLMQGESR